MTAEPRREGARGDLVVLVLVYVVPLVVVTVFLVAVDLIVLAVALLAVEAVVAGFVVLARRLPDRPRGESSRHPLVVPAAMIGVLVALVGLAVLASLAG